MALSTIEIIALSGLALNVGIALVGATMGIAKIRETVREEIDKHRDTFDGKVDQTSRNVGEALSAIRTKMHEIETWARDEFVRKGSLELVIHRQEVALTSEFQKIDKRFDRIESKLDVLQSGEAAPRR